MASLKEDGFYRYITRRGLGWQLRKNGEHYGWYDRIEDALFDRDRLEQCDWDFSVFCELPEISNPYEHMELPPYEERKATFIRHLPQRWRVEKRIEGKLCYFGTYKTFEEAEERRNELIKTGWI